MRLGGGICGSTAAPLPFWAAAMAKAGGSGGTGTEEPERRKGLVERWVDGLGVVGVGADEAVEEVRLEARDDLQKPMMESISSFLALASTPGVYSRGAFSSEQKRTALQGAGKGRQQMSVGGERGWQTRNRRIETVLVTAI
jgi:hypothetical protein